MIVLEWSGIDSRSDSIIPFFGELNLSPLRNLCEKLKNVTENLHQWSWVWPPPILAPVQFSMFHPQEMSLSSQPRLLLVVHPGSCFKSERKSSPWSILIHVLQPSCLRSPFILPLSFSPLSGIIGPLFRLCWWVTRYLLTVSRVTKTRFSWIYSGHDSLQRCTGKHCTGWYPAWYRHTHTGGRHPGPAAGAHGTSPPLWLLNLLWDERSQSESSSHQKTPKRRTHPVREVWVEIIWRKKLDI